MIEPDLEMQIKDYAKEKGSVTIPELQVKFNLAYKDIAPVVHKLTEEKFLVLGDGLEFSVSVDAFTPKEIGSRFGYIGHENVPRGETVGELNDSIARRFKDFFDFDGKDQPQKDKAAVNITDEELQIFSRALAYCIIKKEATLSEISIAISCNLIKACRAVHWMADNGYVTAVTKKDKNYYKAAITKEQYINKFGRKFADLYWDADKEYTELLKKLVIRLSSARTDGRPDKVLKRYNKRIKIMPYRYHAMLSAGFDMSKAISGVPNMDKRVNEIMLRAQNKITIFGREWDSSKPFESLCMDIIENIAGKNKQWKRMDAATEAAKELVAVEYTGQSKEACNVHSRVLYELLDGSDEDYELIKKKLWDN